MLEARQFALSEEESRVLREALRHYVSDLREEIAKTEKHDWRIALHNEKDLLERIIARL